MKTRILLVFSLFLLARISTAQYVTIPDALFRGFLKGKYPTCFNSQDMMDTTCSAVLTARKIDCSWQSLTNLQGIQYFKALDTLNCRFTNFTSLPALPSGLKYLDCSHTSLTSLPSLPSSLTYLDCSWIELPSRLTISALPSGLKYLDCSATGLTNLPSLPSSLTYLNCSWWNKLTSLPTLPNGLKGLRCADNQLTSLPTLPSSLKYLSCSRNQLTSLPVLPSSLDTLSCDYNQLTSLPALPSSLDTLNCRYNPNLSCLPNLPNGLSQLGVVGTRITCLPNKPAGLTSNLPICTAPSPCVLGIEVSPEMRLSIAPNPATETCRVEFDTRGKLGTLTLTDALGRTVKSVELQGSSQHNFSVADMPSGVYYLRVNAEGKLLASGKLVVEK